MTDTPDVGGDGGRSIDPDVDSDPDPDPEPDPRATYADRIERHADRAGRARARFVPPTHPPDEERALAYLRDGLGPALRIYVEARTGDRLVPIPPESFDDLEGAANDWLDLYAACYGVDLDASFALRTAAELLVETRDVRDTAVVLTGVPDRHATRRRRE
jgi:hypothetical protein